MLYIKVADKSKSSLKHHGHLRSVVLLQGISTCSICFTSHCSSPPCSSTGSPTLSTAADTPGSQVKTDPHGMVSWSHSVALSEFHFQDTLLCLAGSRLSDYILCHPLPLDPFYILLMLQDPAWPTEQQTAELNVQSLDSLVALPVARRHQDHQKNGRDYASEA